jgi:hypothetical protein
MSTTIRITLTTDSARTRAPQTGDRLDEDAHEDLTKLTRMLQVIIDTIDMNHARYCGVREKELVFDIDQNPAGGWEISYDRRTA